MIDINAQIENMLEFWRSQRRDSMLPIKHYLDFRIIKQDLQNISLHERVAPAQFIYRVHGTGLAGTASGDHTGKDILDSTPEIWRSKKVEFMNCILDHPCGIRETHLLHDQNRGIISREGLHLPLSDRDGHARYILSYYPPNHASDIVPLSHAREPEIIRKPIGYAEIEFIDLGGGFPDFAEPAIEAAYELSNDLMGRQTNIRAAG